MITFQRKVSIYAFALFQIFNHTVNYLNSSVRLIAIFSSIIK